MRGRILSRIARTRLSWLSIAWLTTLWVLLWGQLSVANVISGAVVAVIVTALLPLPRIGFRGKVRPLGVLRLLARFFLDLRSWRSITPTSPTVRSSASTSETSLTSTSP